MEELAGRWWSRRPGLIWAVIVPREALVEADRVDIKSIWDALEIFF